MEKLPNRSPLSLKQKLFIGFGLIVSVAFLYVNVVVMSQPVRDHFLSRSDEVSETSQAQDFHTTAQDSSKSTLPKFNEVLPDLGDVVSIPHIEFGPF